MTRFFSSWMIKMGQLLLHHCDLWSRTMTCPFSLLFASMCGLFIAERLFVFSCAKCVLES